MVCKRIAPHIRYLSITDYLGVEKVMPERFYAQTMQKKQTILSRQQAAKSATSVASQAAALTNQSGGNIGFTYE